MHGSSDFMSPGTHEYANVRALNTAWLLATTDMKGPQRGRIVSIPFLLFSLREQEMEWWEAALSEEQQPDLLDEVPKTSAEIAAVQAAALGFLWQLMRANPYAARVISGASIAWCDKLAELPLVSLLEKVAWRSDLAASRVSLAEQDTHFLQCVTSSRRNIRDATQRVALQQLLTHAQSNDYTALSAAACAMPQTFRVADGHRTSRKKV